MKSINTCYTQIFTNQEDHKKLYFIDQQSQKLDIDTCNDIYKIIENEKFQKKFARKFDFHNTVDIMS
jgi:hypothetical protein